VDAASRIPYDDDWILNVDRTEKMWAELAPYYDVFYAKKDYTREAAQVHELIQKNKRSGGHRLLDVGCGTGGHLVYLRRNYRVTGTDRNQRMLDLARQKCGGVRFIRSNMTSLRLRGRFDAITCLFGAIAYLKTYRRLERAIAGFACHLKRGGVLILEPFVSREAYRIGQPHAKYVDRPDVKIARINVSRIRFTSAGDAIAVLDFHFLIGTREGVRYARDRHELGLFEPAKVLELLSGKGFEARWRRRGLGGGSGLFIGVKS